MAVTALPVSCHHYLTGVLGVVTALSWSSLIVVVLLCYTADTLVDVAAITVTVLCRPLLSENLS